MLHRDLKPSNVLVDQHGAPKLIDFGIAQRPRTPSLADAFAEGVTPSGRLTPDPVKDAFGTPAYMSPEQILGDFVDGRSDLFSLGVILYEMASGKVPFDAGKIENAVTKCFMNALRQSRAEAIATGAEVASTVANILSRRGDAEVVALVQRLWGQVREGRNPDVEKDRALLGRLGMHADAARA